MIVMKNRDWIYIGKPIPPIDYEKNSDFILNIQKAMLASLIKRNLLTHQQMGQIMEKIQLKNNIK
jgi:hypothetical protein